MMQKVFFCEFNS